MLGCHPCIVIVDAASSVSSYMHEPWIENSIVAQKPNFMTTHRSQISSFWPECWQRLHRLFHVTSLCGGEMYQSLSGHPFRPRLLGYT